MLLTIKQVAKRLQLTVRTVQQLIRDGKIKSYKLGHHTVRVYPDDLNQYIKQEVKHD